MNQPTPKSLAVAVSYRLVAIAVGLALAEAILRLFGVAYPYFDRPTVALGQFGNPGVQGWYGGEGGSWVSINREGLRGPDYGVAKSDDTLRVAVLGDSFTSAFEIPFESTFPQVLERRLNSCRETRGRRVEVLNFGQRGSGTGEQLLILREKALKYDPDAVVLALFAGNDIRNNSRALQRGNRPYFVRDDQGRLVLDASYAERASYKRDIGPLGDLYYGALARLRLTQLIGQLGRLLKLHAKHDGPGTPRLDRNELGLDEEIFLPPSDARWSEAWHVTEDLVTEIHSEVRSRPALLLLAAVTSPIQVNPDPAERLRYRTWLVADDLLYPERRLAIHARLEGIPFLPLVEPLRSLAEERGQCLHGFSGGEPCRGHWNEVGHELVGRLMADRLCGELEAAAQSEPAGSSS